MSRLALEMRAGRVRLGCKGPRSVEWLEARDIVLPPQPNTWAGPESSRVRAKDWLVGRLGTSEFFLEESAPAPVLTEIARHMQPRPAGVYPVLREDWGFLLSGDGADDALAQVCNVHFAALDLDARPLIMTLMIGVSVLIVPQAVDGTREYRIWCDPSFGPYLSETLGALVVESGGVHTGVSA